MEDGAIDRSWSDIRVGEIVEVFTEEQWTCSAGVNGTSPRLDRVACDEWSEGMVRELVLEGLVWDMVISGFVLSFWRQTLPKWPAFPQFQNV